MNTHFQAGHTYLCTDALRQAHRRAAEQAAREPAAADEDTPAPASRVQRVAGLMALVLSCGLVGTAAFLGDALAQRVA